MSDALYRYRARDEFGIALSGTMQAADAQSVIAALRSRAVFVTAVTRENALVQSLTRALAVGQPQRRARLAFFRSFATLLRAGVALSRAFAVTIERTSDRALREALRGALADIEHGASLSAAFSRRPRAFGSLQVAMIAAGETGGILDDVLERLAHMLERDADLRKRVQAALAYPAVVTLAAGGLIIFLIARIVPMFRRMFTSLNVPLPPSTRLLLAVSDIFSTAQFWSVALCIGALTACVLLLASRQAAWASALDTLRLRLPLAGLLLRRSITARLLRTLATLLRAGVGLVTAIEAVAPAAGSPRYTAALLSANRSIRSGETISAAFERTRLFDPLVIALVRVGEETGAIDEMLLRAAAHFEADIEVTIAMLGAVLEPALIGVLGIAVGFIVFSVFLPLYSLIGSLSK